MYKFQLITPTAQQWEKIASCYDSTVFHSKEWMVYYKRIGKEPFVVSVIQNDAIIGYFIGCKVKWGLTMICAPMDGTGTYSQGLCFFEPVSNDKRVEIYQAFAKWVFAERIAGYIQVDDWALRLDAPNQDWIEYKDVRIDALEKAGIPYTTRATLHLPIAGKTEEELWAGLHYKSAKYSVNKATKLGLTVKRITEREDIERFTIEHYNQVKEVYARRGGIPKSSHNRERMMALCESLFPNRILMLEVHGNLNNLENRTPDTYSPQDDDVILATAIWALDKGECSFWTAASYQRYMKYCPNELMVWTAIKIMVAEGCGDHNCCGMSDYKLKYGCNYAYIPHIVFSKYAWFTNMKDWAKKSYFAMRHQLQRIRGSKNYK